MYEQNIGGTRINSDDDMISIIMKMSDGNPGASIFIMELLTKSEWGGALGGLGQVCLLDKLGLYGEQAYMLWNDCCSRNLELTELVLRNFQMGHLSDSVIKENLDQVRGTPFENLKSFAELGLTK